MKRVILLVLFIFCISFVSAASYQIIDWKMMKPGDTWTNISGGYNIKLNLILDLGHVSTTLTKSGTSQINLTKGVLFQYSPSGYFLNVSSVSSGSATLVVLKKICKPDWQCDAWDDCSKGMQWRTCKDINECGVNTGRPSESRACVTCSPSWMCTSWSACLYNKQTRSCKDANNCNTGSQPETTRICPSEDSGQPDGNNGVPAEDIPDEADAATDENAGADADNAAENPDSECDESWQCSAWSQCINGQQIRTCSDSNDCGAFFEMPSMIRICDGGQQNDPQAPNSQQNFDDAEELLRIYQFETSGQRLRPINLTFGNILPDTINIDIPIIQFFSPAYFIWWFLLLLLYIYLSLAYTFIGRRAKVYHYGVAWVPVIGPLLVSCRAAQMGHWPIYPLAAALLSSIAETLLMFSPFAMYSFALMSLNYILVIAFSIFWFIWTWKMFRAVSRPGWWSLVNIVPFFGWAAFLIFLGIAAWGKFSSASVERNKTKNSKNKK